MAKVYVVFQFDVEDFVTPETDEVLLRLAQIMEGFGVKASFCVVGEKARVMESRGRTDVIDALRGQDVAYQSNLHSVHPVISEYLSEKGWDEGVEEVRLRESQGVEAVSRIFGVKPSAFIQPGGSWAPRPPTLSEAWESRSTLTGSSRANPSGSADASVSRLQCTFQNTRPEKTSKF